MKEVKAFVYGEMTPEILQAVEEAFKFIYRDPFVYKSEKVLVFSKHAAFMDYVTCQLIVDFSSKDEIELSIVASSSRPMEAGSSPSIAIGDLLKQLKSAFASHDRELNILDLNYL